MTIYSKNKENKRLSRIFQQLPKNQQQTLLSFAEFLHARLPKASPKLEPELLPRPPNESVILAIKRLSKSYPMLDKAILLNETSRLMTEHIIQGRDKIEVIDELEALFLQHYQKCSREVRQDD
jgi:hypothetical protein